MSVEQVSPRKDWTTTILKLVQIGLIGFKLALPAICKAGTTALIDCTQMFTLLSPYMCESIELDAGLGVHTNHTHRLSLRTNVHLQEMLLYPTHCNATGYPCTW